MKIRRITEYSILLCLIALTMLILKSDKHTRIHADGLQITDTLSSIGSPLPDSPLRADEIAVDGIYLGMTLPEVISILGQPTSNHSDEWLRFQNPTPYAETQVGLRRGKVAHVEGIAVHYQGKIIAKQLQDITPLITHLGPFNDNHFIGVGGSDMYCWFNPKIALEVGQLEVETDKAWVGEISLFDPREQEKKHMWNQGCGAI